MRILLAVVAALAAAGFAAAPYSTSGREEPQTSPLRLQNLGVAHMNQQRFEQALELFQRAYKADSSLAAARLNQGIALLNLQRLDEAQAILEEAVKREPRNAYAWYNLALILRSAGEPQAALEAFRQVSEIDPRDADTHYFLGMLHTELRQPEHAIAAFARALELNPHHVSAEFGLARAHQRAGNPEQARVHLARFERLTQQKLGAPLSLVYGEQGIYSHAQEVQPLPEPAGPAIPVRFQAVSREAGLAAGRSRPASPGDVFTVLGRGACFFDLDGNGVPDLLLLEPEGARLLRNAGKGRFQDATRASRLPRVPRPIACAAADYDNDGHTDLAVTYANEGLRLYRNRDDGSFEDVTAAAAARVPGFAVGVMFVDYDHDGDVDLYLTRLPAPLEAADVAGLQAAILKAGPSANVLLRNNGNGTFTDVTAETALGGREASLGAALTDWDNDRAVDLVVTGGDGPARLLTNPREGEFRLLLPWGERPPQWTVGVAVFDFDRDGWMDLAFTHWSAPGISLWRNQQGQGYERVDLPDLGLQHAWGIAALDYDNDGWLDLAAVGQGKGGRKQVRLLRNLGAGRFEDATRATGLDQVKLSSPRALLAADYDRDGDLDLLITQADAPPVLLRNHGGNRNRWLRIALQGLNDNRSGIGTKVEVFAGAQWQRWEVQSASGYLGQNPLEIVSGLRQERQGDVVRFLWPTGVLQDEIELSGLTSHHVVQIDRRGSSCPVLFAWNGKEYGFITDAIGAGVVGHWIAPGKRNVPDPTEYIRIEGHQLKPRDGRYSLRLLQPMEEVVYLDQARLLAVDHPQDVEVYPNEYFAGAPPFAEFRLIAARGARPPRAAWGHDGRDVLPQLLHRDGLYVEGFPLQQFKGFAELHRLELELPEPYAGGPLRLLMHGFVDYFTANSVYAAHQAGVVPLLPRVEALDAAGRWVPVSENIGFPAGLIRTMTADLSGKLPRGASRIRITTNLKLYWDQILFDTSTDEPPLHKRQFPLRRAELKFHGFPKELEGGAPGDVRYLFDQVSATGPYAPHAGAYTRYGDVAALLAATDDRMVVFGAGDVVELEFDATILPPPPPGWKRTYLFFAHGYSKDMDFYAAHFDTVEPLPYNSMPGYPYAEARPDPEGGYLQYRVEYNIRKRSGRLHGSFRFDHDQPEQAGPRRQN